MVQKIDEIARKLAEAGEELYGLTEKQVFELEDYFGVRFPLTYKRFLLLMGISAGRFLRGSSVFFDEIKYLNDWAKELLEENGQPDLKPSAFVFWMHQGYQFAFFLTTEGDDPPVYYFTEGCISNGIVKKTDSLSSFFELNLS